VSDESAGAGWRSWVAVDHESPASRFKDWLAAVITLTIDFTIAGIAGWTTPRSTATSILGCTVGLGLIFWIGPQNLTRLGGNSQLVPYLPPNAVAPAEAVPSAPVEPREPDPSKVPLYYRLEWRAARWIFFIALAPVLIMFPLRKAIDQLVG
jgi:hypothetical protein